MKQQLLTTIAAVLLVGCGPSIHQTVIDGNEALLRRELSNGANVNEKNEDGYTPLHLAAQSGHKRIVELLIDKGSDVNAKNDDGDTPLDVAIKFKHPKIADLLRKPLNKFWFQYNGQQEPGFRLWERDDNGIWTETYPSGHQSKFKEDGIDKVDGLVGDYVVKLSGDIEKTGTQDGGFRVFIPHYQKKESFLYFSQKSSGNWTDWKETNYSIIVLTTRDGGKVEDMPEEIAALLRKHGAAQVRD